MKIISKILDKILVFYWRLIKCNHDTPMCLDVGDEDHIYLYCFRCMRKL